MKERGDLKVAPTKDGRIASPIFQSGTTAISSDARRAESATISNSAQQAAALLGWEIWVGHILSIGFVIVVMGEIYLRYKETWIMNHGVKTIIYPVKDIGKAKKLFGILLGSSPAVDGPYYVGFAIGEQQIGLLPNGRAQGMNAPLGYFHVDDIKKTLEELVKEGAQISQPAKDVGAGRLVASVKDADGNSIGLIQSA